MNINYPFLTFEELRKNISIKPLLIFKYGLLFTVLLQLIGYLFEYNLIFKNSGLFPDSLVQSYFPSGLLSYGESFGLLILGALSLFVLLALFKKFQQISFLAIFVIEFLLWARNFTFLNFGDYALLVLCLFAAFMPVATWSQRQESVRILDILPLYVLSFIIYFTNGMFKFSSSWIDGNGLKDTLRHIELARFPQLANISSNFTIANYATIFIVFLMSLAPLISFRFSKLRNSLIFLSLAYHIIANIFMNLSWLSLPFIFLQLALFTIPHSAYGLQKPFKMQWQQITAMAFLVIGFFGMRDPIGIFAFNDSNGPVLGHNWYMFAPAPLMTGHWHGLGRANNQFVNLSQQDLEKPFQFIYFQHKYKFFYNLRKTEMLPAVNHFSLILCRMLKSGEAPLDSIQLTYSGRLFRTGEDFQVTYPEVSCVQE